MTNKLIEVLNQNPEAKKLLGGFDRAAEGANLSGEQYDTARQAVINLAISITPAAMSIMANEMYNEVHAN